MMQCVLSFSAIYGDEKGESIVRPYIHGQRGLYDLLGEFMPQGRYGDSLNLILIELYVKGDHNWFAIPEKAKLSRYGAKDKSIGYKVPVTEETFFHLSPLERKEFFIKQMRDAISATKAHFQKKGLTANFEGMEADFKLLEQEYRKRPLPE